MKYTIIAVRAPHIPDGASEEERRALEDGDAATALVMFLEGHGRHGGWGFDPDADTIRCNCGDLAFQVEVLEKNAIQAAVDQDWDTFYKLLGHIPDDGQERAEDADTLLYGDGAR